MLLIASVSLLLTACSVQQEGIYRGGFLIEAKPLGIQDVYVFTFLDKWRVSHSWLSGHVEVEYCDYSRRGGVRGEDRFFEVSGILKTENVSGAPKDNGKKFISGRNEYIYGANPVDGNFKGYSAFCNYTFQDIWTGIHVYLIKPDPAKGTDEWIAGAKSIEVNSLHWLRKDIPMEDYTQNRKQWAGPIEIWVLKIPDTAYWFVMRMNGTTGGNGDVPGINRNPEKFAQVQSLLHQMVASVKLEPIGSPSSVPAISKP